MRYRVSHFFSKNYKGIKTVDKLRKKQSGHETPAFDSTIILLLFPKVQRPREMAGRVPRPCGLPVHIHTVPHSVRHTGRWGLEAHCGRSRDWQLRYEAQGL